MNAYIRQHVARGWSRDEVGKGRLLIAPQEPVTWSLMAFGGPHHSKVVALLNVQSRVAGYLLIERNGVCRINAYGRDEELPAM